MSLAAPPKTDAFLANAVLLTNLPEKLLHPTNLRDVIYTCGGTRGYTISKDKRMAVVRMQNRIGASALFGSIPAAIEGVQTFTNAKSIRSFTDPVTQKFTMSLVPLERVQNDAIVSRIGEVLSSMQDAAHQDPSNPAGMTCEPNAHDPISMTAHTSNTTSSTITSNNAEGVLTLDTQKLRAAAGGGQQPYDDDEDNALNLNTPEILQAVAAFKKKLEDRDNDLRQARQQIVDQRLEALVKAVKQEKNLTLHANANATVEGVRDEEVSEVAHRETGKRNVSNLPAWMTAAANQNKSEGDASALGTLSANESTAEVASSGTKRKLVLSDANQDVNNRKQKLDLNENNISAIRSANQAEDQAAADESSSMIDKDQLFASKINWDAVDKIDITVSIRPWVTEKIVDYLGEEEVTLIDFVMHQISKHCTPQEVLEELTMVLDEDAEGFVVSLWQKLLAIP